MDVLLAQVRSSATLAKPSDGLFQISLLHRFYGHLPSTADDLTQAFTANEYLVPRLQIEKLHDADSTKIREHWQSEAKKGLWRTIVFWIVEIGSLILALAIAFRSISIYRRRVLAYLAGSDKRLNITTQLFVQFVLFVVGMVAIGSQLDYFLLSFMALLFVIIWPYELIFYLVFRYKYAKRSTTQL